MMRRHIATFAYTGPMRYGRLAVSLLIPQAVGWIGALYTVQAVTTWYPLLTKPPLTPPSWIFGPVWTALYLLMGISLYRVWRKGWRRTGARELFVVQLGLNAIWSPVFFGMRQPGWALLVIALLVPAVALTIVAFARIDRVAAWLLVPYLAWISFATYLNAAIWVLN